MHVDDFLNEDQSSDENEVESDFINPETSEIMKKY